MIFELNLNTIQVLYLGDVKSVTLKSTALWSFLRCINIICNCTFNLAHTPYVPPNITAVSCMTSWRLPGFPWDSPDYRMVKLMVHTHHLLK